MKKSELIAKLEGVKELTSVVSIDLVLAALGMLEEEKAPKGPVFDEELIGILADQIESALDYNSDECVDKDSAEFSLNYDNRIELDRIDLNVYEIMQHVTAKMRFVLEAFELEAADEAAEADEAYEGTLRDE
jgi:hypothetical protein